jgi:uncharacterized membrane protein
VKASEKYLAFLAYFIPIGGWLYILLFRRERGFARYHAKQSLALTLLAIGSLIVWAIAAWVFAWVPLVGPIISVLLFTMVMVVYVIVAIDWVLGMVYALQTRLEPIPFIGGWAERTF